MGVVNQLDIGIFSVHSDPITFIPFSSLVNRKIAGKWMFIPLKMYL